MEIGSKIKELRMKNGLTQEELADRSELSKGFISQLENDVTSPSISTLEDILQCLGMTLSEFFAEVPQPPQIVFGEEDYFEKEDAELQTFTQWIIPNAQKNSLEPILVTLVPGGRTWEDDPHEGEEFGYVLAGSVVLRLGERSFRVRRGSSFCFKPSSVHFIENPGKTEARVLWVSTPPSF